MRWQLAEWDEIRVRFSPLSAALSVWTQVPQRRRIAMVRAGLLLICFLLGFAGAALVGPRQLHVSPIGLKIATALLAIVALAVLASLAMAADAEGAAFARALPRWARPRLDIARGLGLARTAALRCASGVRELSRTIGGVRAFAPTLLASCSALAARRPERSAADCQATVSVIRRLVDPTPTMTLVSSVGSQRASAAADLAVLKKALIESNNQSWRNQHLPVVASLSAASLARLRVHRAIRGRRDRVSLTAAPLTILLAGGPRPELVVALARLLLPSDVGRALQPTSLDGIDTLRLVRAGVSFVALSAPSLVYEARRDRATVKAVLAQLAEAGIGVIAVDIEDSVVLAQLSGLGIKLGEGGALTSSSQRVAADQPVPAAARVFRPRSLTMGRAAPSEPPPTPDLEDVMSSKAAAG